MHLLKNIIRILSISLFLCTSYASAATLSEWSLTVDGGPSNISANVSAGNFTSSGGIGALSFGANGAYANGWSTGAQNNNHYFQITLDPNGGYKLNITDINFGERRSLTGIRDYQVEWSVDGFATSTVLSTINVPDDDLERSGSIGGLDIDVANGETLTVRFFGYNSEGAAGTWRINDDTLQVLGSVSEAVPPTISGVVNTPATVTNTGLSLQTDITFNENMDTSIAPTVTLNGLTSSPYTATGSWLNATTYRANFTITDDDEEVVGAGFTISGAHDVAGNVMAVDNAYTVNVDTKEPVISEVTSVPTPTTDNTPNYTFTSDYAGTIVMTGPCKTTTAVSVIGNNTITLDSDGAGGGLADGVYATCQIQVQDNNGNLSNSVTISSFEVDTTPPQFSSIGVTNPGNPLGYAKANDNIRFTLNLSAADSFAGGGAGIGQVTFTINGGAAQTVDFDAANTTNKSATYTATYDLTTYPGAIPNGSNIQITGITFQDYLGHNIAGFVAPYAASPTVIIDTVAPGLQSVTYATTNANPAWARSTDIITYTVTYDEDIQFSSRAQDSVATALTNLTRITDFNLGVWGASDTMTFQVVNGNNGPIALSAGNFTVTDKAGNTTTTTNGNINTALATWIAGGGTLIQADTINPTLPTVSIASNNADTTLAKTNDTIRVTMITVDNLSPTVHLSGAGNHILNKALTGSSLGLVGVGKYIERFTDGTETSEVVVPFSFTVTDEAGNTTTVSNTTNASTVRFDRTNPLVQDVSISAVSSDSSAYLGDVPTYYAKQGDSLTLSFETCDWVDTPIPSGTILGQAVTMDDDGLTGGACTTPQGNAGTWHVYSKTLTNIDGTEGTVPFAISVYDTAGNGVVNVTGTTDGSRVIFDKTRPTLPTSASDIDGAPIVGFKARSKAQFTWTGDTDPNTSGADFVSDIWKYKLLYTNPYTNSVDPYTDSNAVAPISTIPYTVNGELHQGAVNAPVEVVLATSGKTFDGRTTQLNPWASDNGLIPPRKNDRTNNKYYPYRLRMIVQDKAGNHSCDETGTYCSSQGNYDWQGKPVYEQPYTIRVQGTLYNDQNEVQPNGLVQIIAQYGEYYNGKGEIGITQTDAQGKYEFLVNPGYEYNLVFYKHNYYQEKKNVDVQPKPNGVYDDKKVDGYVNPIGGYVYQETLNKKIFLIMNTTFLEGTETKNTIITVDGYYGQVSYTNNGSEVEVTSIGRITSVTANNPAVEIIDNGNNTFTIRNGGTVRDLKSGLSDVSQGTFASSQNYLGTTRIPSSGKADSRRAGEKREDHVGSNKFWTEEESKADVERKNQAIPKSVKQYTNRNGYQVFAGYQPGSLGTDDFPDRYQNEVRYRGENRRRMTKTSIEKDLFHMKQRAQEEKDQKDVYEIPEAFTKEYQEKMTDEQKSRVEKMKKSQTVRLTLKQRLQTKSTFRKTTSERAAYDMEVKKENDKRKKLEVAKFQRRPLDTNRTESRINNDYHKIVIRGSNGAKVSMDRYLDGPLQARMRPREVKVVRK